MKYMMPNSSQYGQSLCKPVCTENMQAALKLISRFFKKSTAWLSHIAFCKIYINPSAEIHTTVLTLYQMLPSGTTILPCHQILQFRIKQKGLPGNERE